MKKILPLLAVFTLATSCGVPLVTKPPMQIGESIRAVNLGPVTVEYGYTSTKVMLNEGYSHALINWTFDGSVNPGGDNIYPSNRVETINLGTKQNLKVYVVSYK